MLYENIVNESTSEAIISLINDPVNFWLLIFAVWFTLYILLSLINRAAAFGAVNKFNDVEQIKKYKSSQNISLPAAHCWSYFNVKRVKPSNIVSKVILEMYCDGYNNLEILPGKYIHMFKTKLNKILYNKFISVILTVIVFILCFPAEHLREQSGIITLFVLIEILFVICYGKFLENTGNNFGNKVYSDWYNKLCSRDKLAAEKIENSKNIIAGKIEILRSERKIYKEKLQEFSKGFGSLNENILSLSETLKLSAAYDYTEVYQKLISSVGDAGGAIKSYQEFTDNFETLTAKLLGSINSAGEKWKDAKNISVQLAEINNHLDEMKTTSASAVVNVLKEMKTDVTQKISESINIIAGDIGNANSKLQNNFKEFSEILKKYTDYIEKDKFRESADKIVKNQQLLQGRLSDLIGNSEEFEKVIAQFTNNTAEISRLITERRKWETADNFFKKHFIYKKNYEKLLESDLQKADTYAKIIEIAENVGELKNKVIVKNDRKNDKMKAE